MGDVVYAANLDGNLYAISLADGSLRWRFPTQEPVRSRPLLVGDVLVVADRGGNVYGLDPASGQARWGPQALGGKVLADLLLLGGEVLVLTQEGRLFVLDPATGQAQGVDIGP
jgi:outer membrane protein assembly factor BamB